MGDSMIGMTLTNIGSDSKNDRDSHVVLPRMPRISLAFGILCRLSSDCSRLFEAMPPKKKVRGGAGAAKAFASGENTRAIAKDMESVCPLMHAVNACIDSMYSLRHRKSGDVATECLPELPLQDSGGKYVWPINEGGTFKDIAQRAWKDPDVLLNESWEMLLAAGLLDPDSTSSTLKEKFCTIEAGLNQNQVCLEHNVF